MTRILVMSETYPLSHVKAHLSEIVDLVESDQERVTITRNGKASAIILHPDDLESLEETLAIMSDPELVAGIREGEAAHAAGDYVTLEELKKELGFED